MQNISSLLQKIYEVNKNEQKSMIDFDVMMDYTRLLYEELTFAKQKMIVEKAPPNFYNIWNNAAATGTTTERTATEAPEKVEPAAAPTSEPEVTAEQEETPETDEKTAVNEGSVEENTTEEAPAEEHGEDLSDATEMADNEEEVADDKEQQDAAAVEEQPEDAATEEQEKPTPVAIDEADEATTEVVDEGTQDEAAEEETTESEASGPYAGVAAQEEELPADTEDTNEIPQEQDADEVAQEEPSPVAPTPFFEPDNDRSYDDIRSLIGINDKYQIMSEIFHNDRDEYEYALNEINKLKEYKEAYNWLLERYDTLRDDSYTVQMFDSIVSRFFYD